MAARVDSATAKVGEHRSELSTIATIARRKTAKLGYAIWEARVKRAECVLIELLDAPIRFGSIGLKDLVNHVRYVREIHQFA